MIYKRFPKKHLKESIRRSKHRIIRESFGNKSTPRVYVGTYRLYNEGSLEGGWFDLSNYDSKEDFYNALAEKFKSIDDDPEYMFQDYENCGDFVSEYGIDDRLFDLIQDYKDDDHGMDWNTYIELVSNYDLENLAMTVEPEGLESMDAALGYKYVDEVGGISQLNKDILERHFDYESFGRELRSNYTTEEIDGVMYLFYN